MDNFTTNILNIYKDKGKKWLTDLPTIIKRLASEYNLSGLKPLSNLSYNYVLSGFLGNRPIILKLGLDNDALKQEASSLQAFAEFGGIKVLVAKKGFLLLEKAIPGISLKSYFPLQDNDSVEIACNIINLLHQAPIPKNPQFPDIQDWLRSLDHDTSNKNLKNYLQKARYIRNQLLATAPDPVLLHGDLHHENIIKHGDNWVVIDSKGVTGEPAYEVAAFIRNPIPELLKSRNMASIINNRIAYFAYKLKIKPERIEGWCFVQAVLAWVWILEDGGNEKCFKYLVEILADCLANNK
ncbi:MAG: phosphotransferase [Rickettsiaceae bacterium]|jgi:streptomycin 6-kinase|nr:phosphotransferase [Rickettsiaceae bacterium]